MAKLYNRFQYFHTDMNSKRSRFDIPDGKKLTFNSALLIPFTRKEILPGDTVAVSTSMVIRSVTPTAPTLDNAFIDYFFFYVPNRLTWSEWKEFLGENNESPWAQTKDLHIPKINFDGFEAELPDSQPSTVAYWWNNTVFCGLGYPTPFFISDNSIAYRYYQANILPIRAYYQIWNEYFRDENTQTPLIFDTSGGYFKVDELPWNDASFESGSSMPGVCLPVNRFKDYFYSLLPQPQRGDTPTFALSGLAPVRTGEDVPGANTGKALKFVQYNNGATAGDVDLVTSSAGLLSGKPGSVAQTNLKGYVPDNLWADMSAVSGITVNKLRQMLGVQLFQERLAVGGGRYREIIKSFFNVTIADSTAQVPEYLGGKRVPVNMTTVLQTTEGAGGEAGTLGATGAMSNTCDGDNLFVKSFTEHGYIIGVMCVRTANTYSQNLDRDLQYDTIFDYFWPQTEHIGEQAVLKSEYAVMGNDSDKEVLGYQERGSHLKTGKTMLCGYFAPSMADVILNSWTYHEAVADSPVLNDTFMNSSRSAIRKTLKFQESPYEFFGDILVNYQMTRIMSVNGTPSSMGLMKA